MTGAFSPLMSEVPVVSRGLYHLGIVQQPRLPCHCFQVRCNPLSSEFNPADCSIMDTGRRHAGSRRRAGVPVPDAESTLEKGMPGNLLSGATKRLGKIITGVSDISILCS